MAVAIADSFKSILDGPCGGAKAGVIDIPVGLPETGKRACEAVARRMIGQRRSSVFSSPTRAMLACATYDEANRVGKRQGAGLSRQCWGIVPKIREVDGLMTPSLQSTWSEGHPELAFTRLRGRPCDWPKRSDNGKRERQDALKQNGIATLDEMYGDLRRLWPLQRHFAVDDFLDACVLALAAEARLVGKGWRLGDDARDPRGLVMEIRG